MPVTKMNLTSVSNTDLWVKPEHFSGNTVYTVNTDEGLPTENLARAREMLGVTNLRFPAGQTHILDIAEMPGGELRPEVVTFLEWCVANDAKANLVLTTREMEDVSTQTNFISTVMEKYGSVISTFEVGNEYWGSMDEFEYAKRANVVLESLEEGLAGSEYSPEIIVQMADTSGMYTAFTPEYGGWLTRVDDANQAIIDGIDPKFYSMITGVVEHYYFKVDYDTYTGSSNQFSFIGEKFAVWEKALGPDLGLHVTEWNIKSTNQNQLGMKEAGTILEQMEIMIRNGVDSAYAWPIQHNTSNDLGGSWDKETIESPEGIVLNSVAGAAYDLMSTNLIGAQLVDMKFDVEDEEIEINSYINDGRAFIYVASRSLEKESISLDLSSLIGQHGTMSGIKIGYDKSSSDGYAYNYKQGQFLPRDSVIIDGEEYFYNEHDVKAEVTPISFEELGSSDDISFTLLPYEIIQLSFDIADTSVNLVGGFRDDVLVGSQTDDFIDADCGDDLISGFGGNDTLHGGQGDDTILGGTGDDLIYGGEGDDSIDAGADNDTVYGGEGNDIISGGDGNDFIYGDEGDDTLLGGAGDDRIEGGSGNDYIEGGPGNDTVSGGAGNDMIFGGPGSDLLIGGVGDDVFIFEKDDSSQGDAIQDFEIGSDAILFDIEGVNSIADLRIYQNNNFEGVSIRFRDYDGVIDLYGDFTRNEIADADNFIFG